MRVVCIISISKIITSHHSPPESDNDRNDNNNCVIHLFVLNGTNVETNFHKHWFFRKKFFLKVLKTHRILIFIRYSLKQKTLIKY